METRRQSRSAGIRRSPACHEFVKRQRISWVWTRTLPAPRSRLPGVSASCPLLFAITELLWCRLVLHVEMVARPLDDSMHRSLTHTLSLLTTTLTSARRVCETRARARTMHRDAIIPPSRLPQEMHQGGLTLAPQARGSPTLTTPLGVATTTQHQ